MSSARSCSPLLLLGSALVCAACHDPTPTPVEVLHSDQAPAVTATVAKTDARVARAASCPPPTLLPAALAPELSVGGDAGSTGGIFDPSIVYPAGAPAGAMAYSSVPNRHAIRTRVAVSSNGGASWALVAEANTPELALLPSSDPAECPGGWCLGYLISEVSSLVYDPTDPDPAARWKLLAHRYLAEANDRLHYRLGTIALQTAPAPQGPWSAPRKLFGLPSPSAYTTSGAQVDASRLAGLADCLALTEPSAIWLPDRLDVAMGCVYPTGGTTKIRVVRVRSTDHGRTWQGLGTILAPGDADCLPGTTPGASVNAADLFVGSDGAEYLSATSSDPGYHGCAVYKIASSATGQIERLPGGGARVLRTLAPDSGQFSGACSFAAGGGGYALSLGFFGDARPFRVVRAGAIAP